jgi:hypothetical protein
VIKHEVVTVYEGQVLQTEKAHLLTIDFDKLKNRGNSAEIVRFVINEHAKTC